MLFLPDGLASQPLLVVFEIQHLVTRWCWRSAQRHLCCLTVLLDGKRGRNRRLSLTVMEVVLLNTVPYSCTCKHPHVIQSSVGPA